MRIRNGLAPALLAVTATGALLVSSSLFTTADAAPPADTVPMPAADQQTFDMRTAITTHNAFNVSDPTTPPTATPVGGETPTPGTVPNQSKSITAQLDDGVPPCR